MKGATWEPDGRNPGNGALKFDGEDDFVDCGDDESLNITSDITFGAWLNAVQWNKPYQTFVDRGQSISQYKIGLYGGYLEFAWWVPDEEWQSILEPSAWKAKVVATLRTSRSMRTDPE